MPAKRILFGFLLCLALWLVVLAAQALTLGTEKSLFPYRTEQVACVEFQNGTTGARHLDKAQRVIQDVMDHLHRFSPDAAVPNQWEEMCIRDRDSAGPACPQRHTGRRQ